MHGMGMAWHGMAWHGMAWHGMAWYVAVAVVMAITLPVSCLLTPVSCLVLRRTASYVMECRLGVVHGTIMTCMQFASFGQSINTAFVVLMGDHRSPDC